MNINIHSSESDDIKTLKLIRENHRMRIRQSAIPTRDPLWQSTLDGKLIKHRDIKRIRKQFSFFMIEEIEINKNNR